MQEISVMFPALGTVNTVTVFHPDERTAGRAAQRVRELVTRADEELSVFRKDSVVSQLNSSACMRPQLVSRDVFELFRLSLEYNRVTYGAFDIAAGSGGSSGDIVINHGDRTVMYTSPRVRADFGGIAKGYLIDRARETLQDAGISRALLNFGGTLYPMGSPCEAGIRSPFTPAGGNRAGETAAFLTLNDEICVTSGQYEHAGHILDPASGRSADSGLISVTLTGTRGAELDALATACMVLDAEKSAKLLNASGIDGVFILDDGRIFTTEGLRDRLRFTERNIK